MNNLKLRLVIRNIVLVDLYILAFLVTNISAQIPSQTQTTEHMGPGTLTNITITNTFSSPLTPEELARLRQAKIEVKNSPDLADVKRLNIQAEQLFTEKKFALLEQIDPSIEPILIKLKSNKGITIAEANQLQADSKQLESNPEYIDAARSARAANRNYLQRLDALILQNDPSMGPILTKLRQAREADQ